MMRSMRAITKPVFWVVAVTCVGWLAYGQVTEILGGSRDTVLKVNGREVRLQEYDAARQAAFEQVRRQAGGRLTREEEQQVENQVVDELTQTLLLEQQYRKLGITVSDQELIRAAQSAPPPEVMQSPEFQTNGQFDISKWQRYLASASDPQFLRSLEARYREQIPQVKLAQYLTADVYVPDAKLWRMYRDQHESVTVALLAIRPEQIPDQDAPVTDAELEQYYEAHKTDFKRPAVAFLSFIAQPRLPDAADSAAALAHARRVRQEVAGGGVSKFEDVAKHESADTASGSRGGDLGWIRRDERGFDPAFLAALRTLHPGELSQPALSSFGYHILRVDAARGDSLHVRHILIPLEPQGKHLEYVESRADTLDKLAAERPDGSVLDTLARALRLPLGHAPPLVGGERMLLGQYMIPDVSVWAFEARVGETSPVIEARPAYYVFRLDSLVPAGTPPLSEIRAQVLDAARLVKKREVAARRAEQIAHELGSARDLTQLAAAHGLTVQKVGPFTRLAPPAILQDNPLAVGAAFGLRPGARSSLIRGATGYALLQCLRRTTADSTAWLKQRDAQRENVLAPTRQARIQAFLAALKTRAKIVDRRKEVFAARSAGS